MKTLLKKLKINNNNNNNNNNIKLKTKKKIKAGTKYCSPKLQNSKSNKSNKFTCFDYKTLKKIAIKWNKNNNSKIKITSNSKTLWQNINKELNNKCGSEWCWINKTYINLEHKDFFKPLKPNKWNINPDEWLDNYNIENVMEQYEDKHKDFIFLGPVPIDFDLKDNIGKCLVDEMCKIKISDLLQKHKQKLGIVFNLDPHNKGGSHWIALYCDIKKSNIYYFDSYGIDPPNEIKILINRFFDELYKINNKCIIEINSKRHQFKNSECGVYCLHFLIQMLKNTISFDTFCSSKMSDDMIFNKRTQYFIS